MRASLVNRFKKALGDRILTDVSCSASMQLAPPRDIFFSIYVNNKHDYHDQNAVEDQLVANADSTVEQIKAISPYACISTIKTARTNTDVHTEVQFSVQFIVIKEDHFHMLTTNVVNIRNNARQIELLKKALNNRVPIAPKWTHGPIPDEGLRYVFKIETDPIDTSVDRSSEFARHADAIVAVIDACSRMYVGHAHAYRSGYAYEITVSLCQVDPRNYTEDA
jgi:hypothetical protein